MSKVVSGKATICLKMFMNPSCEGGGGNDGVSTR